MSIKYKNKNSPKKPDIKSAILFFLVALLFVHNGKFYIVDFLVACLFMLLLSALAAFITITILRKSNKKYVPSKFSNHPDKYKHNFNYTSIQSFEERLLSDGFDKSEVHVDEQSIGWYKREQIRKTKLIFTSIVIESVIIVEIRDDFNFEAILEVIDTEYQKSHMSALKTSAEVLSSVFCIIGQDLSEDKTRDLIKKIQYFRPAYYLTVVLDEKAKTIYRAELPNKKETQVLSELVDTYFP